MSKCLHFDISIKLVGIVKMEYIRRSRRKRTVWLTVINSAILQLEINNIHLSSCNCLSFDEQGPRRARYPKTPRLSVYMYFLLISISCFSDFWGLSLDPQSQTLFSPSPQDFVWPFPCSWPRQKNRGLFCSLLKRHQNSYIPGANVEDCWSRYLWYSQVFVRTLIGFTFACTIRHTVDKLSADYLYIMLLLFSLLVYL